MDCLLSNQCCSSPNNNDRSALLVGCASANRQILIYPQFAATHRRSLLLVSILTLGRAHATVGLSSFGTIVYRFLEYFSFSFIATCVLVGAPAKSLTGTFFEMRSFLTMFSKNS